MSISKSFAWMGSSQVIVLACQFGAQVVLVRHLTLHEAGIYAVGLAVVGVLSLVQTLGLQALIVREEVLTPELANTTFTVNGLISIGLAAAILVTSYAGAAWLGDPGVQRVLSVLAVTPLFGIVSFLPTSVMEREGRFREIAIAGAAGSVVGAVATVILAIEGFTYMSAAYAQWASLSTTMVATIMMGRQYATMQVSLQSWRRIFDFGSQMLAISGISALGQRMSDILLGRILGLSPLGLYSRASGLNGLIWTNVHLLIGRVMLVDFADLHRSGHSLRVRYIQTVDIVTVLLWPIFAGFAIIAKPFILIVYGPKWLSAALPLVFLAIASMTQVAITMTWELFAATGELRIQTRIEFIRSMVALGAFAVGCYISLEAAAASRVVDALFALILYRPHLNRMTNTTIRDFGPIYFRNILLTLLAIAPAVMVMAASDWSAAISLSQIGGSIVVGALLWVYALLAIRHPLFAEVYNWLRNRAERRA